MSSGSLLLKDNLFGETWNSWMSMEWDSSLTPVHGPSLFVFHTCPIRLCQYPYMAAPPGLESPRASTRLMGLPGCQNFQNDGEQTGRAPYGTQYLEVKRK